MARGLVHPDIKLIKKTTPQNKHGWMNFSNETGGGMIARCGYMPKEIRLNAVEND